MSPFLIFAISLTIAYAIYYAVMITRDLYGKKEEAKSNEEVFDISNITEEEAAVAVNESDGGFSVADKQYDTSFQDGTSYDEGYGMGTENNGMGGYSPETDSSGREDDVDEDEGNDVNQQKPKNTAESLQEKMDGQIADGVHFSYMDRRTMAGRLHGESIETRRDKARTTKHQNNTSQG